MAEKESSAESTHVTPNLTSKVIPFISGDNELPSPPLASATGFHLHQDGGYALHDEDDRADGMYLRTLWWSVLINKE
jgi:hypothetical protein